jgi:hypothetical protein
MAEKKAEAPVVEAPVQEPQVDATQQVETDAYVPKYKIKPEFKQALVKAIGKYPFNQTAQIFQALETEYIDHNQLNQVVNVLGNFPYQDVAPLMKNVTDLVEQVVED